MNPNWASIGAAAANHLWQSTLFIGACWLATWFLRNSSASIRHWIWLTASLKFLFPFTLLVGLGGYLGGIANVRVALPEFRVMQSFSQHFNASGVPVPAATTPIVTPSKDSLLWPWLVAAGWIVGSGAVAICGILRWRRLAGLIGKARPLREGREVDALQCVQARNGLRTRIRLTSSTAGIEPGVYGILHPILFLPPGISDRLSDDQLELVIAHELSHIRRHDNCTAAIHVIVETLFWFHPLVWWIGTRLVDERERACDENVLRMGGDPEVYAGAILRVCEFYLATPLMIVSRVTSSNLKTRIEEIMTQQPISRKIGSARKLLLVTAGIVLVVAPIAFGMAKTQPRIAQTASIARPTAPDPPIANTAATTMASPAESATLNARVQSVEPRQDPTVTLQSPKIISTGSTQTAVQTSQDDYIIGPEDELEIVVWRQPDLKWRVVVRPDGKIGFPLLNDVQAAGLSPVQLSGMITRDLKQYVQEPQVAVIVAAAKNPKVTIVGAIARPGRYYLSRPTTVMELIAQAGGLTEFARREQIAVILQDGGASVRHVFNYTSFLTGSDLEQNVSLKAGDVIVVP